VEREGGGWIGVERCEADGRAVGEGMEWSEEGREADGDGGALGERIGRKVMGDDGVKSEGGWGW
jgi:hypothetical protein